MKRWGRDGLPRGVLITAASVAAVCCMGAAVWVLLAMLLKSWGRRIRPRPADAAIILGAYTDGYRPSHTLRARLKVGLQLYRGHWVSHIVVSGGQGDDETVSESRSMKWFLMVNGVPPHVILEDRHSSDTWENLNNSRDLMTRYGIETAIVVTSDYHLPRAMAVAKQLNMSVSGCSALSGRSEFRFALREVAAWISYLVKGRTAWRMN
jgi:uncharacterized SAM-binding protein YcdF (DUF218 family)